MSGKALMRGGKVVTIVRDDTPPGWRPPEGCTVVPASSLAPGAEWEVQPQPQPSTDLIAGVPVESSDGVLRIPARLAVGSDVQVTDADRGIILRDDSGNDWLLVIANGAPTAVQISASPEVSHETRRQRIANARKAVGDMKTRNKGKTPNTAERLELIEKVLGIA